MNHCQENTLLKNCAHRGASGSAPENTMCAVLKAVEDGAQWCEIDVQETADGVLVLLHDGNLKRTTGVNRNIWEIQFDSLKTLDAGSWFNPEFKDEQIPTLDSVIDAVRGKIKLNIELKMNGHEKMLTERVVDLIEKKNFIDNCVITSFDFNAVKKVKQLNGNIKTGFIFNKRLKEIHFTANVDLLSVNKKFVDKAFVKKAHAYNKEVHVWTVNDPDEMKRLIDLGVDCIITNYPDILYKVLGRN